MKEPRDAVKQLGGESERNGCREGPRVGVYYPYKVPGNGRPTLYVRQIDTQINLRWGHPRSECGHQGVNFDTEAGARSSIEWT